MFWKLQTASPSIAATCPERKCRPGVKAGTFQTSIASTLQLFNSSKRQVYPPVSLTQPIPIVPPSAASKPSVAAQSPVAPVVKQNPVKSLPFTGQLGFRKEVVRRVNDYLKANNLRTRDLPAMYAKTGIVLLWWVASYALMIYSGFVGWGAPISIAIALSFGLATACIGFNIMHDANHGGYSDNPRINKLLGLTVELVGLSSFIWKQQHNIWHHTYTNVAGLDEGLEMDGWVRNSPRDYWQPKHRFQHLYAPIVYAMAGIGLLIGRNFQVYFTGKSGDTFQYPPMSRTDKIVFWIGRLINLIVYLIIPALAFGVLGALGIFAITSIVTGFVMAVILQMAHVMNDVEFPEPCGDPLKIENEWAIHEVETTSNFAPKNAVINWYVGGLNFQIEHHLFPQMCHLIYPKIAPIVEETCKEFGVSYKSYPTFFGAVMNHWLSIKEFGKRPDVSPA
jgi:linoleoyl-CoA desaturase